MSTVTPLGPRPRRRHVSPLQAHAAVSVLLPLAAASFLSRAALAKTWNVASDTWSDNNAWSPAGQPTSTDDTSFTQNTTYTATLTAASSAHSITVSAGNITLATAGQTLTLNNNVATAAAQIFLQGSSAVSLTLDGGGIVSAAGGFEIADTNTNAAASLTIQGHTSLTSSSSGTIANGGTGTATITGAGSILNLAFATIGDAINSSTNLPSNGTLSVKSGGAANVTFAQIGVAGGQGTLNVDGAGSRFSTPDNLFIGESRAVTSGVDQGPGQGNLSVTNGGLLDASANDLLLGEAGGTGVASVDGSNSRVLANVLYIGDSRQNSGAIDLGAGNGTLHVTAGGQVIVNSGGIAVGQNGGIGAVTVDGTGSQFSPTGTTFVGNGFKKGGSLSFASNGSVTLSNGASASSAALVIGRLTGAGSVTIASAGTATWTNTGNTYLGGNTLDTTLGTGILTVNTGGTFTNNAPSKSTTAPPPP